MRSHTAYEGTLTTQFMHHDNLESKQKETNAL